MITFRQLRYKIREKISQQTLTQIIIILALITGIVIGFNFSGKIIERECNDFIVETYIIPQLEALGYTVVDGKVLGKDIDTSLFNLTFDLPYGTHDFYDENNNDSG